MIRRALFWLFLFAAVPASAGETVFESKSTRTHLLELFTSEGCSSCPPAEAWFSNLKNEPGLWRDIVPVAFHVDYWNHLGWRDRFASKKWTERQSDYSARWKSESVYTPAFVLDGKPWRNSTVPPAATEPAGVLKITIRGEQVTAAFKPATAAARSYEVHLARLGFALGGEVNAGENRGRKLLHDFVVLGLTSETMKAGVKEMTLPAETAKQTGESRSALAAWVTEAGRLEPVQAVGGWLP